MKKSRLFLSFSMFCLSIAVLCFGVFAAANVNYSISGNISYTITDVFAKINTSIYKVQGQTSADTLATNVTALSQTALADITKDTTTTYELHSSLAEFDSTSTTDNGKRENISLTLDSTYLTYYIVINIENLADVTINAKLTDSTTYTNLVTANNLIQSGIAQNEKNRNLVVAFSIDDTTEPTSVEMEYLVRVDYFSSFSLLNFNRKYMYTFYFESGITWKEWLESGGWEEIKGETGLVTIKIEEDGIYMGSASEFRLSLIGGVIVKPSDIIIDGNKYQLRNYSGSDWCVEHCRILRNNQGY